MGVRQVVDVDVVADAGAVRRIVIRAEDFDVFLFPGQREQDVGDEVGFRVVVFTDQAVLAAAGGIEIAQENALEAQARSQSLQTFSSMYLELP